MSEKHCLSIFTKKFFLAFELGTWISYFTLSLIWFICFSTFFFTFSSLFAFFLFFDHFDVSQPKANSTMMKLQAWTPPFYASVSWIFPFPVPRICFLASVHWKTFVQCCLAEMPRVKAPLFSLCNVILDPSLSEPCCLSLECPARLYLLESEFSQPKIQTLAHGHICLQKKKLIFPHINRFLLNSQQSNQTRWTCVPEKFWLKSLSTNFRV